MPTGEHYPEVADGIDLTIDVDPKDDIATIGIHEPDAQVGFGAVSDDRVIVSLPSFTLGGEYENLRLLLNADQSDALGEALKAAAIECENAD